MRTAICHYSFNRTWTSERWSCLDFARVVKSLGVDGIDFHAELLGDSGTAIKRVRNALDGSGLALASLSLSNDFNRQTPEEQREEVKTAIQWVRIAGRLGAPVSRIFGGSIGERGDGGSRDAVLRKVTDALGEVALEAAQVGVVLALENHGGLPCTGEEQARIIEAIGSPFLRATVDVGNYLQCGQEGHVGTQAAARHAAYVHFKDYKRSGAALEPCAPGQGVVDHERCLRVLEAAGYAGFIALEYEGVEEERAAVSAGVIYMNRLLARLAGAPG